MVIDIKLCIRTNGSVNLDDWGLVGTPKKILKEFVNLFQLEVHPCY